MKTISEIIDQYLLEMSKSDHHMTTTGEVIPEMIDNSYTTDSEWKKWKPINSQIEDSDLAIFEGTTNFIFPPSYKEYLKHKCFYSLILKDHQATLYTNLPDSDMEGWITELEEDELSKKFLKEGFLQIGSFSDYGYLCFNKNIPSDNHDYPIYFIDHEDISDIHFYTSSFKNLLENDADYGNRFILKLNEYYRKSNDS